MKLTSRTKPWHNWLAWFPVQDWETGQWYWLETVWRKYRVDGTGARWYYKPVKKAVPADTACHSVEQARHETTSNDAQSD